MRSEKGCLSERKTYGHFSHYAAVKSIDTSSMASIISTMLQQLFPKVECRCLMVGLDAAGKTTLLYKVKLGEVVTTIPTIGFNVETIEHAGMSFTMWDVGGCDKIRPLWRHYYQNTQVLIVIVDTNDAERFDESVKLFSDIASEDELRDAIILIYLNKTDLSGPEKASRCKERFLRVNESLLRNKTYHTQFSCAPSGVGLYEGFDWLAAVLQNKAPPSAPKAPVPTEKDRLEIQLEEWLTREDDPPEGFLSQVRDFTLDSWDHYTHLRIAYILLSQHGRREGMKLIFRDIKAFIENSPRTRRGGVAAGGAGAQAGDAAGSRGTTFHETMTYFWVHMVHYAMESSRAPAEAMKNLATAAAADQQKKAVATSDWKVFLLLNPQLANGGLFLHYYSKQRMLLDADARTMVLLPDKLPLPSLLVDVKSLSLSAEGGGSAHAAEAMQPKAPLTDVQFLRLLVEDKLPGWGHEVKLRIIYLLLCRWGCTSKSDDGILAVLQGIEKAGYHLSLNYFWVQMVTYHIAVEAKERRAAAGTAVTTVFAAFSDPAQKYSGECTLQRLGEDIGGAADSDAPGTTGCMPFAEFLLRPHCQPLRNAFLYDKYFSKKVVDAEASAREIALPDLRNLPSVV